MLLISNLGHFWEWKEMLIFPDNRHQSVHLWANGHVSCINGLFDTSIFLPLLKTIKKPISVLQLFTEYSDSYPSLNTSKALLFLTLYNCYNPKNAKEHLRWCPGLQTSLLYATPITSDKQDQSHYLCAETLVLLLAQWHNYNGQVLYWA
jgi:hypothetical protein